MNSFFDESLNFLKNFINDVKKPYEKRKNILSLSCSWCIICKICKKECFEREGM